MRFDLLCFEKYVEFNGFIMDWVVVNGEMKIFMCVFKCFWLVIWYVSDCIGVLMYYLVKIVEWESCFNIKVRVFMLFVIGFFQFID